MHNATLPEILDIVADLISVDANGDQAGSWRSTLGHEKHYLLLAKPAGTAGDDLAIKLEQAQDGAGTGAKRFRFARLWHKVGNAQTFTPVNLDTPTDDLDLDNVNGVDLLSDVSKSLILVEVRSRLLDVNEGFTHVRVSYEGDDIANALTITSLWLAAEPQY